jgi:hypothetical protein
MMVDFHACSWPRPELNAEDTSLADYFDAMNDEPLRPVLAALQQKHTPTLGRKQSPGQQRTQPSAADAAADGAANGTARSTADGAAGGPGSDAQPAVNLGSQGQQAGAAAANGHAATAAVDACPDSSGGASSGPQTRPPIITFSHYLPHQVSFEWWSGWHGMPCDVVSMEVMPDGGHAGCSSEDLEQCLMTQVSRRGPACVCRSFCQRSGCCGTPTWPRLLAQTHWRHESRSCSPTATSSGKRQHLGL